MELVFGPLPGAWRADPEAVGILAPLLELTKRAMHGTLDVDSCDKAWAGPCMPEGGAGTLDRPVVAHVPLGFLGLPQLTRVSPIFY